MTDLPQPPKPFPVWRLFTFAALTLLPGCASGNFGEVNPALVTPGIHDWIGRDTGKPPVPPSTFEFTDDERALRDNAYPLIEPPFDRQRWYSVAGEYGLYHTNPADRRKYFERLMADPHKSSAGRYAQLNEDIRDDNTRLSQFFETAGRVLDIDQKRIKSLDFVSGLSPGERQNALRRVRENRHVVDLVRRSLGDRVAGYQFALERLVVTIPSVQAVDAERLLKQLQNQIVRYDQLPPTWQREPSLARSS
jgi:hypothetical protein